MSFGGKCVHKGAKSGQSANCAWNSIFDLFDIRTLARFVLISRQLRICVFLVDTKKGLLCLGEKNKKKSLGLLPLFFLARALSPISDFCKVCSF